MKKRDIAAVVVFFSLFLILLLFNTMYGVNMNLIWIQSPELDIAGPQELDYKLLGWNKIVKMGKVNKDDESVVNEKLFVSGLSEYQNIDALKYEKLMEINENMRNSHSKDEFSSQKDPNVKEKIYTVKASFDDKTESNVTDNATADSTKQSTVKVSASSESSEEEDSHSEISKQEAAGSKNRIDSSEAESAHETPKLEDKQCDIPKVEERFDCHPENFPSKEVCVGRGCCWVPTKSRVKPLHTGTRGDPQAPVDVPFCYYPKNFPGYTVTSQAMTKMGFKTTLQRNSSSYYPRDVKKLVMDVSYETEFSLHVKIYDPVNKRYEVPLNVTEPTKRPAKPRYRVSVSEPGEPFSISVNRAGADSGPPVFSTAGAAPLIFCDQFLQLSSFLPSKYIYGLGEHRDGFLHSVNWTRFTMWNRDQSPMENANLYGSHPFYMVIEDRGSSGVFVLNSNAMDVVLQPAPAITWRSIGGILDFYIFIDEVIPLYTTLIGTSFMPPYWSLGFHICRFGYKTVNETMKVVDRVREAGVPQDVQWNDIDYAIGRRDFTTDLENFGDQAAMVAELHRRGMHYVIITDPGISNNQTSGSYLPYDLGLKMDIFIKNDSQQLLVGKVWPGTTVWPDFTHPSAQDYWYTLIQGFHEKIKFDGFWIDMNEVSNFVDGSVDGCPHTEYDYPPYVPAVTGGSLYSRTICASARQYKGRSYNLHSTYGLQETQATFEALKKSRGKRPFVISRSTFPGQGHFGGHWTGDNKATWHDMYRSISAILTMSISGIPMVGADICGFGTPTTYQLCLRWYQLGAFYPFSRSHNAIIVKKDQDPGAFDARFAAIVRRVYLTRYSLLPYLYYLFWWSNQMGDPVARPLWYGFNMWDNETYANDRQFLWGDALMISPVLSENITKTTAYFPSYSIWYDFYTGKEVSRAGSKGGNYVTLDAPLDHINLHVRGGHIIPMQDPALTTSESRKNFFSLLVVLNMNGDASGVVYWDDGESIDTFQNGSYNEILLYCYSSQKMLFANISKKGYNSPMLLRNVTFYGFEKGPSAVTLDIAATEQQFQYDSVLKVLKVPDINPKPDLKEGFMLRWKY